LTPRVMLKAYAKINWGLELLSRRPDGYHEIRTVTHTVSLHDDLWLEPMRGGIDLRPRGRWAVPRSPDNICWRAARGFMDVFGEPSGLRLTIHKRIPVGAGLGGGSSDGVATLVGLARLTGLGTAAELRELAIGLGSDTALFLEGGAALCSGRGDVVSPLGCAREYDLVIAKPREGVPTPLAYSLMGAEDFSDGSDMDRLADALRRCAELGVIAQLMRNAFTQKVCSMFEGAQELLSMLRSADTVAAGMSGSGSAIFAVAPDAEHAQTVRDEVRAAGYWCTSVHTVDRGYHVVEEP